MNKEIPKISIVMTVYNNEKYFPIAVDNIIYQDYKDWELIIVDDGSTDQTPKIAEQFAMSDHRIHIIHQENRWVYAALNTGIKAAKGEYIFVHNSDDKIRPGVLRLLAQKVEEHNPDVIWTPVLYHKCDEEQNIIEYDFTKLEGIIPQEYICETKQEVEENWMNFWKLYLSDNQVNLYRAEIMKRYPFREDMFCGDAMFNMEIADEITKAVVINVPIYDCFRYCVGDMNVSFGKWYENEHEMYNLMYKDITRILKKWNRPKEEYLEYWNNWRMDCAVEEINRLCCFCRTLSLEKKLERAFSLCMDDLVMQCVRAIEKEEVFQRRVLRVLRKFFKEEHLEETSNMYFVKELVDAFTKYESGEPFLIKEGCINHPLNRIRLGEIFI